MASIHPTRYGTFEIKWRENGRPRSATRKTSGDARALLADIERRLAGGRPVVRRKDVPTLEEFAAEWLGRRRDLEQSTKDKYKEWLEVHILPDLGHLSLLDLRPRRLAEWQADRLDDGAGPAVLGKAQSLLGQILKKAVLPHEYLDVNPVAALDRPTYEKREHRWLTAGDAEKLRLWFQEHDDPGSATLISILAYVGIRPQDALALSWTDVGDRLSVTRKNSQGKIKPGSKTGERHKRTVYLPELVAADLEEWRALAPSTALLFPRPSDGQPWTKHDYDNWRSRQGRKGKRGRGFKAAAVEMGLGASLKPYDLRHTAASLFAACGWSAVEIGNQLGHSPTESQRTYQHLIITDGNSPRKTVDDYIREARGLAPARKRSGSVRDSRKGARA
jgi:integrase